MLDLSKPIRIKSTETPGQVHHLDLGNYELTTPVIESAPDAVTVGDLNSSARGTAARKAAGKPDLSQLPWWIIDRALAVENGGRACEFEGNDLTIEELRWQTLTALSWWARGVDNQLDTAFKLTLRLLTLEVGGDTISPRAMVPCVKVLEFGAVKYKKANWAKGMDWSVCFNSAMSHLTKALAGLGADEESGLSHDSHLMCNILFLLGYRELYPEGDDRIPEFKFNGESDIPF